MNLFLFLFPICSRLTRRRHGGDGRESVVRNQGHSPIGLDSGSRTCLDLDGNGSGSHPGLDGSGAPPGLDGTGNHTSLDLDGNGSGRHLGLDGNDAPVIQDHAGDGSGTHPGLDGSGAHTNLNHSGNGCGDLHGAHDGDRTVSGMAILALVSVVVTSVTNSKPGPPVRGGSSHHTFRHLSFRANAKQIMQSLLQIRQDAAIQSARSDLIERRLNQPTATASALSSADTSQSCTRDAPSHGLHGSGNGYGNHGNHGNLGNHSRSAHPQFLVQLKLTLSMRIRSVLRYRFWILSIVRSLRTRRGWRGRGQFLPFPHSRYPCL